MMNKNSMYYLNQPVYWSRYVVNITKISDSSSTSSKHNLRHP